MNFYAVGLLISLGFLSLSKDSDCVIYQYESKYSNNQELINDLKKLDKQTYLHHRLYDIGKSVAGVPLLVFEFNEPLRKIGTPHIKYVGGIHGDEAIGREVLLGLLQYLDERYPSDKTVKCLLENTKISILPALNPDGFNFAQEGNCLGNEGRYNLKGIDLNRNFPDKFHQNSYGVTAHEFQKLIQPETSAIMKWMSENSFVLSASMHAGAVVANYPYDSVHSEFTKEWDGSSLTPDNDVFVRLAKTYAQAHPTMSEGVRCPGMDARLWNFTNGITNGARWYDLRGGMQDYNYIDHGCFELTLEISCCKYPLSRDVIVIVQQNIKPLIKFGLQALQSIRGQVIDSVSKDPIPFANLRVKGRVVSFRSNERGEYWRILEPGTYTMMVEAAGYKPLTKSVTVGKFNENSCTIPAMVNLTMERF